MSGRLLGSIIITWLLLTLAAVINGAVRQYVIMPRTGEAAAHVIATVVLCLVILAVSWFLVGFQRLRDRGVLLRIGVVWLVATVVFEFVFGHYVMGQSWGRLLADYNILHGRIWVLVLLTTLFGPLLAARFRTVDRVAS
jgi:uncharacterized membrane protein YhaH (DUF805 family)